MRQTQQLTRDTATESAPCSNNAREKEGGPLTYSSRDPPAPEWENTGKEFRFWRLDESKWRKCLCWQWCLPGEIMGSRHLIISISAIIEQIWKIIAVECSLECT